MKKVACMGTLLCVVVWCCPATWNMAFAEENSVPQGSKIAAGRADDASGGLRDVGDTCTVGLGINCQVPDLSGHGSEGIIGATSSTESGFAVQENFVPAANGNVTTLCWWGFYLNFDLQQECGNPPPAPPYDFQITYYNDDNGAPGTVITSFAAGAANITWTGRTVPSGAGPLREYEYTFTHAAVPVVGEQQYWVEVQADNSASPECSWLWETAPPGDLYSYQAGNENDFDLGFCINLDLFQPPPPEGDDCNNPFLLDCNTTYVFNNRYATNDASDVAFTCHISGSPAPGSNTVYFQFVADAPTATVRTCLTADPGKDLDTLVGIYRKGIPNESLCSIGNAIELACGEDNCGYNQFMSEACATGLTPGNTYYIQVASFSLAYAGELTMEVICGNECTVTTSACCFLDNEGQCFDETLINCLNIGGQYVGDNTSCLDDPYPCSIGACCQPDDSCLELVSAECATGTACVRNPDWICDLDTDGNGVVNPIDSGLVMASFGSTDPQFLCNYDIDCNGVINPIDSGLVMAGFGSCNPPRPTCPGSEPGEFQGFGSRCSPATCDYCGKVENCQFFANLNAWFTDVDTGTIVYDNFQINEDGELRKLCWEGPYLLGDPPLTPTNFAVIYYGSDASNLPDLNNVVGSFSTANGTLSVTQIDTGEFFNPDVTNVMEMRGEHAPIAVTAGTCLWVTIYGLEDGYEFLWNSSNPDFGGDNIKAFGPADGSIINTTEEDEAFCVNVDIVNCPAVTGACCNGGVCTATTTQENCAGLWVAGETCPEYNCAPPANDLCANGTPVGEGEFEWHNQNAGTELPDGSCGIGPHQDLFYRYTATVAGNVCISLCEQTNFDAFITVYNTHACLGTEVPRGCQDDNCGPSAGIPPYVQLNGVTIGQQFTIRVGGWDTQVGDGLLRITPGIVGCPD